jgi:hypothetical protein
MNVSDIEWAVMKTTDKLRGAEIKEYNQDTDKYDTGTGTIDIEDALKIFTEHDKEIIQLIDDIIKWVDDNPNNPFKIGDVFVNKASAIAILTELKSKIIK